MNKKTENVLKGVGLVLLGGTTVAAVEMNGPNDIKDAEMKDYVGPEKEITVDADVLPYIKKMNQKGDNFTAGDYTFRASRVNNPKFIMEEGAYSDHELWIDAYDSSGKRLDLNKSPISSAYRADATNTYSITPEEILSHQK